MSRLVRYVIETEWEAYDGAELKWDLEISAMAMLIVGPFYLVELIQVFRMCTGPENSGAFLGRVIHKLYAGRLQLVYTH